MVEEEDEEEEEEVVELVEEVLVEVEELSRPCPPNMLALPLNCAATNCARSTKLVAVHLLPSKTLLRIVLTISRAEQLGE